MCPCDLNSDTTQIWWPESMPKLRADQLYIGII